MCRGRALVAAVWVAALGLTDAGCAARATSPPASAPQPAAIPLATRLAEVFEASEDLTLWAVLFSWADTGEVIYARHPDLRLLPASNMKLVTLAAAIQQLGWGHRFETVVHTEEAPVDGVVEGPLYVTGSGDPTLGWPTDAATPTLRAWARALRAHGVVRIEGDLVGDADAYGGDRLGDSWSWDDLTYGYAAPYAGLTFHENTVAVVVTPGAQAGDSARVALEPAGSGLSTTGLVATGEATTRPRLAITRGLADVVLTVTGDVPVGTPPFRRYVAVPDPPRFFLEAFRLALAAEGIDVRGHTRVARAPAQTPGGAAQGIRVVHRSPPLADVAVRFMKDSQNLYGEALLHALVSGPASTLAERRIAVAEALAALGVPATDIQVADGSGLSRRNFLTPRVLVTLLRALDAPRHREAVRRSLPIAGVDGTLERRMSGTPCQGRVRAKTGTLSHARALSGYLETGTGREIVFSVLANNHLRPTADVDAEVDRALVLLCQ